MNNRTVIGAEVSYGFGLTSRTLRPPQWRLIRAVDFHPLMDEYCHRRASPFSADQRAQYAEAYANETLMQEVNNGRSPLYRDEKNEDPITRGSNIRFLLSVLRNFEPRPSADCERRGVQWACEWMAPRFVGVNLTESHPLTGLDYELFRQPVCIESCEAMMQECPEIRELLLRVGLFGTCHQYSYGDTVYGRRWASNESQLPINEVLEAYARPVTTNLTEEYIRLDTEFPRFRGLAQSEKVLNDSERRAAWENDLATHVESELLFSEPDAVDLFNGLRDEALYNNSYFVRSADGRRHHVPCVDIYGPSFEEAGVCQSEGGFLASKQSDGVTSCSLVCPSPFLTDSQHSKLGDARVATGATTIVCTILVLLRLFFDNARHSSQSPGCRRPLLPQFPARLSLPLTISFLLVGIAMVLQPTPCSDPVTPADGSGSVCALQAMLFVGGAVSSVAWWAAFAACLGGMLCEHRFFLLNNSASTRRFEATLYAVCWLPALVCAILPVALDRVRWNDGASMCGVDTSENVTLLVLVFVAPIMVYLLIGAVSVVLTLKTVCESERRMSSMTQRSKSTRVIVMRFALFVPCFLATAVLTIVLELRRLGVPARVRDALALARACVTSITNSDLAFNPGDLTRLRTDECIDSALGGADTGISFGAELATLVCWMLTALLVAVVFAAPLQLIQRCMRISSEKVSSVRRSVASRNDRSRSRTRTEVELEAGAPTSHTYH
ncbi:MAG: hypothetical protein MHM6MM_000656 [Cercozoa sp. M6MM]